MAGLGLQQQRLGAYHAGSVRLTGTLHVSFPTEILQLFGTGSVPVIVAGSVLSLFELGERFASQRAKDALSKWLVSFDVRRSAALPDDTPELFERIFGERHFTLKCFIRSAAFSVGTMAFISTLLMLIYPEEASEMMDELLPYQTRVAFALWLLWSILIDYVSLFKTRVILRALMRIRLILVAITILVIDFMFYSIIYAVGAFVMIRISMYFMPEVLALQLSSNIFVDFVKWLSDAFALPLCPDRTRAVWDFIFFWSGFAPSIWMWLYVLALFVTRGLLRSERIVSWLRWALPVETNPFRSIGAAAATLAFIASVAIILVSVEVSRISAAS